MVHDWGADWKANIITVLQQTGFLKQINMVLSLKISALQGLPCPVSATGKDKSKWKPPNYVSLHSTNLPVGATQICFNYKY